MFTSNVEQIELFLEDLEKKYGESFKFMVDYSASDGANKYTGEATIKVEEDELIIVEGEKVTSGSYKKFPYDNEHIKFLFNYADGSLIIKSTANSQGSHEKNTQIIVKISAR